jgi:hypothetical protein
MPGVKGRSGPPGNLNGAKYLWSSFWSRKALRQADKWIQPFLKRYMDDAVADAGGLDNISSGQLATLEVAQVARGCVMLILGEIKAKGYLVETLGGWDLAPGMKELPRFLALELTARRTVGLERQVKARSINDLLSQGVNDNKEDNGSNGTTEHDIVRQ